MGDVVSELLALSHRIGQRGDLAILGEGNTSIRSEVEGRIWVKASGHSLETLTAAGVVECEGGRLVEMVKGDGVFADGEVDAALMAARVNPVAGKPSVEAYFHAVLLSLPGVNVVAHAHPEEVNSILCSGRGRDFAEWRLCPDEVVCCGGRSLWLPYVDPGLELAREIWRGVRGFAEQWGKAPKVILLGNHGVICPAGTSEGAWAAMAMTVKAAKVFRGAEGLGGAVRLSAEAVERLDGRADEAYRRGVLGV